MRKATRTIITLLAAMIIGCAQASGVSSGECAEAAARPSDATEQYAPVIGIIPLHVGNLYLR